MGGRSLTASGISPALTSRMDGTVDGCFVQSIQKTAGVGGSLPTRPPKCGGGHFAAPPGARGYDWPRSRCGGEARGRSAAARSIAASQQHLTHSSLSLSLSLSHLHTGHVLF